MSLSTTQRGYGYRHQMLRERWKREIASGGIACVRCGRAIVPGMRWDLDHTNDRSGYLGPAHRKCNRAAGARKANRRRKLRRVSRKW